MIDVHAHYLPEFLVDAFRAAGKRPALSDFPEWSPERALALMAEFGIDRTIMSVSTPGVHFGNDEAAAALARQCNDYMGRLREDSSSALDAFAALPLPAVDLAIAEAIYALDVLKLPGVGVLSSYGEHYLGDSVFDPLFAELDKRSAVIFIHPMGHQTSRNLGLKAPLWVVEYPTDTTRAAVNMILHSTLTKFSNIRVILAHAGGALPYLSSRISSISLVDKRFGDISPEYVEEQIGRFYYEVAQSTGPETFAALSKVTENDHILFGSDFPFCNDEAIGKMLSNISKSVDPAKMMTDNALSLFPDTKFLKAAAN